MNPSLHPLVGGGLKGKTSLPQSLGLGASTAVKPKRKSSPSSAKLFQPTPKVPKFSISQQCHCPPG